MLLCERRNIGKISGDYKKMLSNAEVLFLVADHSIDRRNLLFGRTVIWHLFLQTQRNKKRFLFLFV